MKKQIILKMKHFFKDYIKDIYIKLTFFLQTLCWSSCFSITKILKMKNDLL